MAKSRDGNNLFTEARLEEIRARMEAMDSTTVSTCHEKILEILDSLRAF